jgi:hypothetical protein
VHGASLALPSSRLQIVCSDDHRFGFASGISMSWTRFVPLK